MARSPHSDLGELGEQAAADHLERAGYRILARGYRCPSGEIDLVALRKKVIAFVEVKTRGDDDWADPEDAVNFRRRRRMVRAAGHFLATRGRGLRLTARFDIVGIVRQPDGQLAVRHIEEAFDPTQTPRASRRHGS